MSLGTGDTPGATQAGRSPLGHRSLRRSPHPALERPPEHLVPTHAAAPGLRLQLTLQVDPAATQALPRRRGTSRMWVLGTSPTEPPDPPLLRSDPRTPDTQ